MEVKKVLLEDLLGRLAVEGKLPWRMMFTTFFHGHEVEDAMRLQGERRWRSWRKRRSRAFSGSRTSRPGPRGRGGGRFADPYGEQVALYRRRGPRLLRLERDLRGPVDEVRTLLERVRAVACSRATAELLLELGAPDALEVIEEELAPDRGGVEMLGRVLRRKP